MATKGAGENPSRGPEIQAVSRAGQVLALFGPGATALSAADIADRLGLNRTTGYRYCMSLAAANLLERTPTGEFTPGPLLTQLGAFAIGRRDVVAVSPQHMREVSQKTGLTSVLGLWGTNGAVVSRVEEDATSGLLVTVRVGTQLSLDTAQSHLFLAFHHDQLQVNRLLSQLGQPEQAVVQANIDAARRNQFSVHEGSGLSGIAVVAAPVFADHGICAAIALLGTTRRLPLTRDSPAATALISTAARMTEQLGGRVPD